MRRPVFHLTNSTASATTPAATFEVEYGAALWPFAQDPPHPNAYRRDRDAYGRALTFRASIDAAIAEGYGGA